MKWNLLKLCGVQEVKSGDTIQRLYFTLSILILTSLLAGCAPSANAQAQEVKAVENSVPTDQPKQSQPADSATSETLTHDPPDSCPVTVPQDPPFTAPEPYSPNAPFVSEFWFGSENLWTALPTDAVWYALPHNPQGYTQKIFWWSNLFSLKDELEPALVVTGERLDAKAPPLIVSKATNAYAGDIGSAMLVGVDFPTLGCWKIAGRYKDAELIFVVWIAP